MNSKDVERCLQKGIYSQKELDAIADVVLNYRPKSKQPKPRKRKKEKVKRGTER
jgi:hypothetical protein